MPFSSLCSSLLYTQLPYCCHGYLCVHKVQCVYMGGLFFVRGGGLSHLMGRPKSLATVHMWKSDNSFIVSSVLPSFFCLFVCFFVCFSFVVPETDLSKKVSTPLLNHTHPTKARHMLGAEQVAHRPCAHFSLNKWGEERTGWTCCLSPASLHPAPWEPPGWLRGGQESKQPQCAS